MRQAEGMHGALQQATRMRMRQKCWAVNEGVGNALSERRDCRASYDGGGRTAGIEPREHIWFGCVCVSEWLDVGAKPKKIIVGLSSRQLK